ncbi:uncharacterized protein LOC125178763 [Hyalella azteca]|uniref:Uncharacterized protein LOC125178763 n=1 Tax=Hyalella azteca TaxID=294128 RepID=A0A979FS19_HYAAZ|nr:uncharacterized protein LOC125178763 [Hyalella azteca]
MSVFDRKVTSFSAGKSSLSRVVPQTRTASLPLEITDEFCEVELTCRIQLKKNENVLNESVASELEETFSRAESSLFAACRQKPFKVPRALAGAIDEVLSKPIVESLNIITEDVLDAQAAEHDESSSLISTCCEETQVLEEETQVLTKSSDDDAAVTPLDNTSKVSSSEVMLWLTLFGLALLASTIVGLIITLTFFGCRFLFNVSQHNNTRSVKNKNRNDSACDHILNYQEPLSKSSVAEVHGHLLPYPSRPPPSLPREYKDLLTPEKRASLAGHHYDYPSLSAVTLMPASQYPRACKFDGYMIPKSACGQMV